MKDMGKKWTIAAIILVLVGAFAIFILPLLLPPKAKLAIRTYQTSLNDYQAQHILKAPIPTKSIVDEVIKYAKDILGTVSMGLGVFMGLKQFVVHKKKKRAVKSV
jgi:hypothetical protein